MFFERIVSNFVKRLKMKGDGGIREKKLILEITARKIYGAVKQNDIIKKMQNR